MRSWRTAAGAWALACIALLCGGVPADSHSRIHDPRPHTSGAPSEFGCPILPADNALNEEVAGLPASPSSESYVASISARAHLHPDFGTNPAYGIPYTIVGAKQRKVPIKFTEYGSSRTLDRIRFRRTHGSRRRTARRPPRARRPGRELQAVRALQRPPQAQRQALDRRRRRYLRPAKRSAAPRRLDLRDAAGLPIFPLLARYPEVARGEIDHALRVTVPKPSADTSTRPRTSPPPAATRRCRR
jgi:hypothetical protein